MRLLKLAVVLGAIVALALIAHPASAAGSDCWVDPAAAPVGTVFTISCWGFTPNTWTNVYAVEPDGRASGIDTYGFFPTNVKSDGGGYATFYFVTEYPAYFSVPVGHYTFVVQELAPGGIRLAQEAHVEVQSRAESYSGAYLEATVDGRYVSFWGWGFAPWEAVNTWVTQPPGAECSGIGIDQLSLGALGTDGSSLWSGPQTVKADGAGNIAFTVTFNSRACIGEYHVTARALGSGRAAEAKFTINGDAVTESGGAWIWVDPDSVPTYNSSFTVYGAGFPANSGVNCWFTRPDGRVLDFINQNATTDAGGSFATGAYLDDFPPYTSSEPGMWYVTCATPDHSYLAIATFWAHGLTTDP